MDKVAVSPYNPLLKGTKVVVYDSTLRDGEQTPGVAFSPEQKVAIARMLDDAGVHQIEAGFPAVSENEVRTIKEISSLGLKADILALSRVMKGDIDAAVDAGVDMVLLFVGTSEIHLRYKMKKTREEVLAMTADALDHCKARGVPASVSAEDTTRTDLEFLMQFYRHSEANGAVRVGVTDTLGCATPEAITDLVSRASREVRVPVALHLHNDFGLATANAIAGVKAGAAAVTTTVNGIGERAGNVPLEQFAVALKYLYGTDIGIDCTKMKALSDYVCAASGLHKPRNQPLVGTNVFAHESGIHVAAILNCPMTYESIPPEAVGNERHIIMGKKTGVNYVKARLEEMRVQATDQQAIEICRRIKELGEKKGRVSNAEFNAIVAQVIPTTSL
ncbi:MAG: homoaconitate hydratase [Methanomassiliicoccus sp.]|nr:homoaconitate hydratase [Methanomassiliicoccus sp.]